MGQYRGDHFEFLTLSLANARSMNASRCIDPEV